MVVLMLLFSIGFLKANPISLPPVISEFYLVNDSTWYLELYFDVSYYSDTILDGYQLTTSSGSALLKYGIHIYPWEPIVITNDSLQNNLNIYRAGDFIRIEKTIPYSQWVDEIGFGNSQYSFHSPIQGQSIVNLAYGCFDWDNQYGINYKLVKDNFPNIGESFTAYEFMGTFSGKIYDLMHNPINGIIISNNHNMYNYSDSYCSIDFNHVVTNSLGEFNVCLKSGLHYVELFTTTNLLIHTWVFIEPDSVNYYEFIIDTILDNVKLNSIPQDFSLSGFPNPSDGKTTFSFEFPENLHYSSSLIKIFNSNSEIIRILPIDISSKLNKYSVEWDGKCYDNSITSGIYYYNLELDGRKVASNKLVIIK